MNVGSKEKDKEALFFVPVKTLVIGFNMPL
jgi:hypothetical protein